MVTAGQQRIQGDGALLRVSEPVAVAADGAASGAPAAKPAGATSLPIAQALPGPSPCGPPVRS